VKRHRLFIIISASIAAVILGFLLWPSEREPEYNGVTLSKWLQRYNDDGNNPEAAEAIRHIGTNALPFLLRWIRYETPGWRKSLEHLHTRLPSSIQKTRVVHWLFADNAEHRAELSVEAFSALKLAGKPASDELLRLALANDPRTRDAQRRATIALMNMTQSMRPGDFVPF
jgi:hypothetical protein